MLLLGNMLASVCGPVESAGIAGHERVVLDRRTDFREGLDEARAVGDAEGFEHLQLLRPEDLERGFLGGAALLGRGRLLRGGLPPGHLVRERLGIAVGARLLLLGVERHEVLGGLG
jgi:hypothetical protein